MRNLLICLIIALVAEIAQAAEIEIKNVLFTYAREDELNSIVVERDTAVYNINDPHDLRIGDGVTTGGWRVCRTDVLTNAPSSFPHPIQMNEHAINLSHTYSIGAEGAAFFLRSGGSNVLAIVAGEEGVGTIISRSFSDDIYTINMSVPDNADTPLVQYSSTMVPAAWTGCTYSVSNTSPNTMRIDITTTEDAGYYRISALSGHRARFAVPVHVPALTVNGSANVEAGAQLNSLQVGVTGPQDIMSSEGKLTLGGGSNWNSGAYMELGADTLTGNDVANGSAQLVLRNNASSFRIRDRDGWNSTLEVKNESVIISGALNVGGAIIVTNLPTTDPGVNGQLWRNTSNLYISTGNP